MTTKILDGLVDGVFWPSTFIVKDVALFNAAAQSINYNNTFVPAVSRVIYNLKAAKKDGENNVLATIVFFNDGTKVTVINSDNDDIEVVTDEKTGVKTASMASKERALTYAICKKLFGKPDEKGAVQGNGFGRKLRDLVNGAWDQKVEEKKTALAKAASKAKHEENMKRAAAKPKRLSLAEAMDKLTAALGKVTELEAEVNSLKKGQVA